MAKKYFGTDGIRGLVGKGMISPDKVLQLGWATGKVIKDHGENSVMIGKDTRISGYMFESALEAGFIAAGVDVYLLGPMPTPAVAYLTQTFRADAGIVISASHNPHHDNGIKYFSSKGKKVTDLIELEVEKSFEEPMKVVTSEELGKAKRIGDAAGRYIEFCKSTYSSNKSLVGCKIVLDCANGATYHIAPSVFEELGADVIAIGVEPDGININLGCGATDLALLKETVVAEKADFGIAFDGDGDRVMMVDHEGNVIDGDGILYILASNCTDKIEGVVGTLMSNLGLELAIKKLGLKFIRTNVGDRYVMQELVKNSWLYGAEASGHVLCLDKTTTGDGIIASLQVVSILMKTGKSLNKLMEGMKKYPQILENVRVAKKVDLSANKIIQEAVKLSEAEMSGKGRVLLRVSGTEPLIRVMVEGETLSLIEPHVNKLVKLVKNEFC